MAFFINSLEMTIELYLSIFSFKYFPFMFLTPALNSDKTFASSIEILLNTRIILSLRLSSTDCSCLLYTSVPDTFQILFVFWYLVIFQSVQFVPSQEYHLFRGGFQFGFESIVCHVLMMPFFEAPAQKPFEESHLFADGRCV